MEEGGDAGDVEGPAVSEECFVWTGKPGDLRLWHRPELNNDQRSRLLGCVDIDFGEAEIVVGEPTTVIVSYHPPATGLPAGARLRLAWRWPFDWWPTLQQQDESEPGYTAVLVEPGPIAGDPTPVCFEAAPHGHFDPFNHLVELTVGEPGISAGGRITLVCGAGAAGWQAPTFACTRSDFAIALWTPSEPRWQLIAQPQGPRTIAGPPARLLVTGPADVVEEERCVLLFSAEDEWGNLTQVDVESIILENDREDFAGVRFEEPVAEKDQTVIRILCRFRRPGVFRIPFSLADTDLKATCNPIRVHSAPPDKRWFFGDLHSGQTDVGCGAGSLTAHFCHARVRGLQFASQQANDHYVTRARWAAIHADTAAADGDGFVAFLGCEWSPPTTDGGDRNVIYGDPQHRRLMRSGRHYLNSPSDPEPDLPTALEFHEQFRSETVILNLHVGGRPTNLEWHEPAIEPLAEIHSTHATSEWFIFDALERGFCIGITAGADGVTGRPGGDHPGHRQNRNVRSGLTAVLAEELTAESLWDAFCARRVYATTGERILLCLSVNGRMMGERAHTSEEEVQVNLVAEGTAAIDRVDLLCGTQIALSRQLAPADPDGTLRFLWSGAERRGTAADQRCVWDGHLRIEGGRVVAERSINFQSADDGAAATDGGRELRWRSTTAGNSAGLDLRINGPDDAQVFFETGPLGFDCALGTLRSETQVRDAGGLHRQVKAGPAPDATASQSAVLSMCCPLPGPGHYPIWVRVIQVDGAVAWSTPVYLERE
ncbi:MAG: DUF3604 domain-containing protein [Candidatus Latescibacterota bacterium]|nr:DUF3604 domain-containing protein [Candidatus Latescibacterota bacterium]